MITEFKTTEIQIHFKYYIFDKIFLACYLDHGTKDFNSGDSRFFKILDFFLWDFLTR